MIGWASPTHIALLLLIALVLFGARRLPEIGKSLGSGMREFKDSVCGAEETKELAAQSVETATTRQNENESSV